MFLSCQHWGLRRWLPRLHVIGRPQDILGIAGLPHWSLGLQRLVCGTWDIWPLYPRLKTLMARMKVEEWSFEKSWIRLPSVPYMSHRVCDCISSLLGCKEANGILGRDLRHPPPHCWHLLHCWLIRRVHFLRELAVTLI